MPERRLDISLTKFEEQEATDDQLLLLDTLKSMPIEYVAPVLSRTYNPEHVHQLIMALLGLEINRQKTE